jgi:hypothetical protein
MFASLRASASGATLQEFKSVYDSLQRQVLDRTGEVAEIDSFTYTKDVATFHFGKGVMLLQRPVFGRPTVAGFVGKGHVHIDIPVEVELQAFRELTHDSLLDENFQVCIMRIGDDFDLQLKSKAHFSDGLMGNADFAKLRDARGEYYFKPTLFDLYDNLTQLAVSTFERKADGYFWACFNNKVFLYDPNRPEEINVSPAVQPTVTLSSLCPRFQRRERDRYALDLLSDLFYQVSVVAQNAKLEMGGADGWMMQKAEVRTAVRINADSLRFVRLFLDKHLAPDSISCNGQRIDWFRRFEFYHLELLLPQYARQGDTLAVTIWVHDAGNQYAVILPFSEDPTPFPSSIQLVYPKTYNYAIPSGSLPVPFDDDNDQCQGGPIVCHNLWFQPLPTGYDTLQRMVDDRLSLIFIRPKDTKYLKQQLEDTTADACHYFLDNFGLPSNLSVWHVLPYGSGSALGIFRVPVTKGNLEAGGLHAVAGNAAADAWLGPTFRPASYREAWMIKAVPDYIAVLYAQKRTGNDVLYAELNGCRREIEYAIDQKVDVPLAVGDRANPTFSLSRGVWLLHMLRILMFDLDKMNDDKFMAFLKDVITQANSQKFSNTDFCRLAEQHFGGPLDWFFAPWLYKRSFPSFESTWKAAKNTDGYYVDLHVVTTGVDPDNVYPVMLRVVVPKGSALLRQAVAGSQQNYRIGPFSEPPTDIRFNEYESVLCKSKIRKL